MAINGGLCICLNWCRQLTIVLRKNKGEGRTVSMMEAGGFIYLKRNMIYLCEWMKK